MPTTTIWICTCLVAVLALDMIVADDNAHTSSLSDMTGPLSLTRTTSSATNAEAELRDTGLRRRAAAEALLEPLLELILRRTHLDDIVPVLADLCPHCEWLFPLSFTAAGLLVNFGALAVFPAAIVSSIPVVALLACTVSFGVRDAMKAFLDRMRRQRRPPALPATRRL